MKTKGRIFLLTATVALFLNGAVLAQEIPSITGGTSDGEIGEGTQTLVPAPVEQWHPAARFYGFQGIDRIATETDGCGESYLYAIGYHQGDLVEYLMQFGGAYRYLILRGKADRPGPLELDIYVDGQYQATVELDNDDNLNQEVVVEIPRIAFGTHAVAVELAVDEYVPGGGADQDLNLYLEGLMASSSGLGRTIKILSDGTWKAFDREVPGWHDANFDDTSWRNAYAPYPNQTPPGYWICGTRAEMIWDYPGPGTPDGFDGPTDAWFRKTFNIAVDPSAIESAQAVVAVDDDFELFVNGILAEPRDWDGTLRGAPYTYDIKGKLRKGKNVLAVHGRDSYGLNEWFLLDATIKHRPLDLRLNLRVEDAPVGFAVHKLAGDLAAPAQQAFVDFQARLISSVTLGPIPVVLTVPDDLFGAPVNGWVKSSPGAAPSPIEVEDLGDGRYQIAVDPTLYPRHEVHLVWRFQIPNNVEPRRDIHVLAEIDLEEAKTFSSATLHLLQPGEVQAIMVANRTLLYRHYDEAEVTRLLSGMFIEAQGQPLSSSPVSVIYYADRYDARIENWDNTNIDYTDETTANEVANLIDALIEDWWEDSVRYVEVPIPIIHRTIPLPVAFATYLLIVGDDNTIPFYRYNDPSGDERTWWRPSWDSNLNPAVHATDENYILTDTPYADLGGNDWQTGDIELSVGRLLGVTAANMFSLLVQGVEPNNGRRGGVVMAGVDGWELGLEPDDGRADEIADLHDVPALFRNRGFAVRNDDIPNSEVRTIDVMAPYEGGEDPWNNAFVAAANHASGMDLFFIGGHDQPDHAEIPGDDFSPDDTPARYTRFRTDHPIVMITGCHGGLPVPDIDVPQIPAGGVDGNMVYDTIHEGARAYIGATGFSYGSPHNLHECTWGERLIQQFFAVFLSSAGPSSIPIGQAFSQAKRDYVFGIHSAWSTPTEADALDRKTVTEFNLYGVPWATLTYPGIATPFATTKSLTGERSEPAAFTTLLNPVFAEGDALYTREFDLDIESYTVGKETRGGTVYDLFSVPGGDISVAPQTPILPFVKSFTLPLPYGAALTEVEIIEVSSQNIGTFNIPIAVVKPWSQGGLTYTTETTIAALFPADKDLVQFQQTGDGLLFTVFPIQHNPTTNETHFHKSFKVRVTYEAPLIIGIRDFATDKPQYFPGEPIETRALIDNVGDVDLTVGVTVVVKDAVGNPVGPSPYPLAIEVPAGETYELSLPCGGDLLHGAYTAELSLLSGGEIVAVASARFAVVGIEISELSTPVGLKVGQTGAFEVTVANHDSVEFLGQVLLSIQDLGDGLLQDLPPMDVVIGAQASITVSFSWAGTSAGVFNAIASVNVGDVTYASRVRQFEVRSLTGGEPKGAFGSGSQTDEVTEPNTWRWAEDFYGFDGIDEIKWMKDGSGQWHNYVIGWHQDDLVEYLIKFGGEYSRLILRGLADRPGPVQVAVYVDGQYMATAEWHRNNNRNQDASVDIPGIPYGTHAIAVRFVNDYYNPGSTWDPDRDRNLHLDGLLVTQSPEEIPSLTGGEPKGSLGDGHQTEDVTEPGNWRWSRYYYGLKGIDEIKWMKDACGANHNYVVGWHQNDLAEYLMKFGGIYDRLTLRGIADRPGPVRLEIFVDGRYKATAEWNKNNNCNQDVSVEISGIPYGTHAVAVKFVNDHYNPGSAWDPNRDRNMFLDGLRVSE